MVRKTTRSALKAVEKPKSETPRRVTRRRGKSPSSSEESNDDMPLSSIKTNSPSREVDKESSANSDNSETESKKPLKKRTRTMALQEEAKSARRSNSRTRKGKNQNQVDDEEVKSSEEQSSKGKSKNNRGKMQSDGVVNPETESATVQVTDESPNNDKDDMNGNEKTETVEAQTVVEVSSKESVEAVDNVEHIKVQEEDTPKESEAVEEDVNQNASQENKNDDKNEETPQDPNLEHSNQNEEQQSERKPKSPKKIRLKRPRIDKERTGGDIEEKKSPEKQSEESGVSVDITTTESSKKQTDDIQESVDELGEHSKEEQGTPAKEEECGSSYENNKKTEDSEKDNREDKSEEKPARKRIMLKRSTVDEKRVASVEQTASVSAKRSISLQDKSETRRLSSAGEDVAVEMKRRNSVPGEKSVSSEVEEHLPKPKKNTKVVKLIRKVSAEEPAPPGEEPVPKRGRQWGPSALMKVNTFDSDALGRVCSEIEFLQEEDVTLEIVKVKENRRKTFTELEQEEMENIEAELNAEEDEEGGREEEKGEEERDNIIAMNRKISIVEDTAGKLLAPPSPASHPTSQVLFITNLVRPFTVKQLRELLERTGKVVEDGFWTDRIKSKCYVCYETQEEAEATRNALHGVHWPIGNGKKLIIDFATEEDLENAKNPPAPPLVHQKEKSPEKENKKPTREEEAKEDSRGNGRTTKREWESEKEERRRRSRTRSKERQRKHSRRSYTPEADYHTKKRKYEEPVPQKAMDDLFLKTKATPSIYWLPLSPEEIALKQQQRQERLEANKRRMEEIQTRATVTRRDRVPRDRPFRRR